jgi:hypothetical protein
MPRSARRTLLYGTLLATTAVSLSFAAPSGLPEDSELFKSSAIHCDDKAALDPEAQPSLWALLCEPQVAEDRAYLLATASPGDTMTRQGPEIAIERLNPEFVARLASAIRDARDSGLPSAGIFSAYRPPAFGVGGFKDKFRSLHAYGLAVDMSGIGDPGSQDAKLWHQIAARHGLFCPYGYESKTEWNHCQATPIMSIESSNPLRKTITAAGPAALEEMFKAGSAVIDRSAAVAANRPNESDTATTHVARTAPAPDRRPSRAAHNGSGHDLTRVARKEKPKIVVASLESRHVDKPHRKAEPEPKTHESHKAARGAEHHREPPRRHSRLA